MTFIHNNTNPFDKINLSEFISDTYSQVWNMNTTKCKLIRRLYADSGNYGDSLTNVEFSYEVILNINPVRDKSTTHSLGDTSTDVRYEVYSNPQVYPNISTGEDGTIYEEPLVKILPTDIIVFKNENFVIDNFFESVGLHGEDNLWQHFVMRRIQ